MEEKKIYSVNLTGLLGEACSKSSGCVTCKAEVTTPELTVLKVAASGSWEEDCEATSVLRNSLSQGEQKVPLIRHKAQCMVPMTLTYKGESRFTTCGVDTGAMLSCLSRRRLSNLFPHENFKLQDVNVLLKSAGDQPIKCHGALSLECSLGNCTRTVKFHIIDGTDTILLSYPDICAFHMVLNTSLKYCTVNNVTLNFKEQIDDVMLFHPKYNYSIEPHVIQYITLLAAPKKGATLNNCQVNFYFCHCCLVSKKQLCDFCKDNKPLTSVFLTNLEVTVPIKTYHTALSRKDKFQAVRWPCKSKRSQESIVTVDNEVNMVNCDDLVWDESLADPAGYCLERGELYLESPSILGDNPGLREVKENPGTFAINLTDENTAQKCTFCTASDETSFFCNVTDPRCEVYQSFKQKILGPSDPCCQLLSVSSLTPEMTKTEVIFMQIIQLEELCNALNLQCVYKQIHEFKEELLSKNSNSELFKIEEQGCCLFVCLFKKYLYFDSLSLINKVLIESQLRKLTQITFINFYHLTLSERALATVFQLYNIKIYLLQPAEKQINMIQEKHKGFILEAEDRERSVDKLEISEKGKQRLKEIFREVSSHENGLQSVFAKHSLDVSHFCSAKEPHPAYVFDFQLKPEAAHYVPIRERCRYVNQNIHENVKEIMTKLRDVGVVFSGFSNFNAQSVYVGKRIDQTLEEHLADGGTAETFVPGTVSTRSFGLRATQDFWQTNSLIQTVPLNQEPPWNQLISISADAKYISSLDACSMYYCLKLSKDSVQYTGFNSGLKDIGLGDLNYSVSPMGISASVVFQNCALTHALEGVDQTKIWADNIIVYSREEAQHIDTLGLVLRRLRQHGLKVKYSKMVLCAQDKIACYGFTLSIKEGRLFPNKDKLQALKMKEKPQNVSEMKSLLGSFAFFKKFTSPLVSQSLAILSEMTRKNKFEWNEKTNKAYEELMILLSFKNIIHICRPDFSKPIFSITDSSTQMCSFIIYQLDEQNRPKILQFDSRVLPERQKSYPPLLCELFGLVNLVSELQTQFSYHNAGVVVYTDSKPIILICQSSAYNSRLARVKIFLTSLPWLRINYQRGKSEVIATCDHFTRSSGFQKKFTQKLPKEEEIHRVNKVAQKLSNEQELTTEQSFFVMDYLLNKSETDLDLMEDNSCYVQGEGIKFKLSGKEGLVDGPVMSPNSEGGVPGPESVEQVRDVQQVVTRAQSLRNLLFNQERPESKEYPNMFRCLQPLHSGPGPIPVRGSNTETGGKIKRTGFQGFFQHFLENVFLLDKDEFVAAQKSDPHISKIIIECSQNGESHSGDKTYFLYENMLFSRREVQGVTIYRVVLPYTISYDVLQLLHRQRGHIRENKLLNLAQLYFDMRSGDRLAKLVCSQCWQCTSCSQIVHKNRCDMPKSPKLLSAPRVAISVDELMIYRGQGIVCKVLMFVCLFSHHLEVKFIRGNLTSDQFLTAVKEIKSSVGQDWKYLITDGASSLENSMVHQVCEQLGLLKLTTSAYSHKSNVVELINKLLLQLIRQLTAEHACNPDSIEKLVVKAVSYLNSCNFANSKWLSPHCLYFGTFPTGDIFNNINLDGQMFKDKESYFKAALMLQKFLREIRTGHLRQRAEKTALLAASDKNKQITDQINIGDHITIINRHREAGGWQKIFQNYEGTFQVIGVTGSLLYCVPVVKHGDPPAMTGQGRSRRMVVVKIDKSFVRKIKVPLTVSTRPSYFEKWGARNYTPAPLYFQGDKIDTFANLYGIKKKINSILTLQCLFDTPELGDPSSSILTTFRDSQYNYMIRGLKPQPRVQWRTWVNIRHSSDDLISFPFTERGELKESGKRITRFLHKGTKVYSCSCNYCRVEREHCYLSQCPQCIEVIEEKQ